MTEIESNSSTTINPFAPPSDFTPPLVTKESLQEYASVTLGLYLQRLAIWTTVCVVSAGPSFFWGWGTLGKNQIAAMCVGILAFILAYSILDIATINQPWRKNRRNRITLRIGYITRMVISAIFPIGGILDMFCGMVSIQATSWILGYTQEPTEPGFWFVLAITIAQGLVLNAVLVVFMSIVHLIQMAMSGNLKHPE